MIWSAREDTPTADPRAQARCPLCGEPNRCALALPEADRPARCWCVDRTFPPDLLAKAAPTACICARCLEAHESGDAESDASGADREPRGVD